MLTRLRYHGQRWLAARASLMLPNRRGPQATARQKSGLQLLYRPEGRFELSAHLVSISRVALDLLAVASNH
jgi:hypothetical protein